MNEATSTAAVVMGDADALLGRTSNAIGVSSGHIRSLILEKEKELHDINEYRIRTLEGLLKEKEAVASNFKQKFNKLQEDFKYNLKLLEGRDEELALYDTNFASLKNLLRDREVEVSELKAQAADLMEELKQEKKKCKEQEAFFQQKLKDSRAQMEGARWNFDDELRRQKDEMEAVKRQTERQLREKDEDVETQRREITITFDEVMRNREKEFQSQLQQHVASHKELQLQLKNALRDAESAKQRNDELKSKLERLQQELCEAEKQTRAVEWQLNDVRHAKDTKIAELEQEIAMLQEVKQELLDEYESKMGELLQSLHSVEKAFVQQKTQYEQELKRVAKKKDDEKRLVVEKHDAKMEAMHEKLREAQEELEQALSSKKQLEWDRQDQMMDKQNQLENVQHELEESQLQLRNQQKQSETQLLQLSTQLQLVTERHQQTSEQLAREKALTKSLQSELEDEKAKVEMTQKKLVTESLRSETLVQEKQQEVTARMELRLREVQQQKEKAQMERVAAEEKLAHVENECSRLRTDLFAMKTNSKALSDTLAMAGAASRSGGTGGGDAGVSPIWSDDHGFVGMSPLMSESPVLQRNNSILPNEASSAPGSQVSPDRAGSMALSAQVAASTARIASLETENARLQAIIRGMREAVSASAQAGALTPNHSPECSSEPELKEAKLRIQSLEQELAACKGELTHANDQLALKVEELELLQQELAALRASSSSTEQQQQQQQLQANRVLYETQLASLKQQLASSKADVERLLKERTQLMELSNQLTSDLRKLKEASSTPLGAQEFAGRKDFENLVSELTRQLEESRLHNKTLKKELRRMIKLQMTSGGSPSSLAVGSVSSPDMLNLDRLQQISPASNSSHSLKRRSSTLEMLQGLERQQSTASNASEASNPPAVPASSPVALPPPLTINMNNPVDLKMEILRTKLAQAEDAAANSKKPSRRLTGQVQELQQQTQADANPIRRPTGQTHDMQQQPKSPKSPRSISKLEAVHEADEELEETHGNGLGAGSAPPSLGLNAMSTSSSPSLMQTFFGHGRERNDSMGSSVSEANASKVTDARLKLKQAKEMLELVGKKAERTMSLPLNSAETRMATRSSDRATSSQKSAMQKLKELQTKRAEMVQERRKVRNYSMIT